MLRLTLKSFRLRLMAGLLLVLFAAACHDAGKPAAEVTPAEIAQREGLLNQHLLQLQSQVTQLNQQITQLQQENQQRLKTLYEQGTALSVQIAALQQSLTGDGKMPIPAVPRSATEGIGAPSRVGPPPPGATEPASGGKGIGRFLIRLIAVLVVIGALWIIVRIFIGRWGDDEEEDEDLLSDNEEPASDAPEDDEIVTDEGTIHFSPAAQPAPHQASPESEPTSDAEAGDGAPPKA